MADPVKTIRKRLADLEKDIKKTKATQKEAAKTDAQWQKYEKSLKVFEKDLKDVPKID